MNQCHLGGNLTRDPETFTAKGVTGTKFGIAVNGRPYIKADGEKARDVMFLDCTAWGKTGELVAKHFGKGKPIYLHGELRQETWEKEGTKHSKHTLTVNGIDFSLGGGKKQDDEEEAPRQSAPAKGKKPAKASKVADDEDNDGEIPF